MVLSPCGFIWGKREKKFEPDRRYYTSMIRRVGHMWIIVSRNAIFHHFATLVYVVVMVTGNSKYPLYVC